MAIWIIVLAIIIIVSLVVFACSYATEKEVTPTDEEIVKVIIMKKLEEAKLAEVKKGENGQLE